MNFSFNFIFVPPRERGEVYRFRVVSFVLLCLSSESFLSQEMRKIFGG